MAKQFSGETQESHVLVYPHENQHDWLENPPFEDVSPIKNDDFPASHVSLFGGCIL